MYLNDDEKNLISKEIENLEKESSSELVAVITKQSSSYKFETISLSLFITVVITFFVLLFDTSAIKLFQIQVISFFIVYFTFQKFNKTLLTFLPKSYKYSKASNYAHKQFSSLGLQTTKTKQASMSIRMMSSNKEEVFLISLWDSLTKVNILNSICEAQTQKPFFPKKY